MLARATGKEFGEVTFINIKSTDLLNKYIGGSEARLKVVFEMAKQMAPTILFIDEIEGIMGKKTEDSKMVTLANDLLTFTSDLVKNKIFLIGCTNYPQRIDQSYMRRFSRRIYVPLPNEEERFKLINKLLLKQHHTLDDEDITLMAKATNNYSPAEIDQIFLKAKDMAMWETKAMKHFKPAFFQSGFFTPCHPVETNAAKVSCADLPSMTLLPLPFSIDEIKIVLKSQKPATNKNELNKLDQWMKRNKS